ncbi:alginate export family protein [Brevundimonas sp.]|uniref:alginate export family protein n=1 Tax=Brevundimonas sp. TaxID=1871086 RepID=UPI0025F9E580|nr:alginate export family protein [Brevundimonas sp.]
MSGALGLALALHAAGLVQDQPWTLQDAIGEPERLTVSGSVRARYEMLDGQYRPGLTGSDQLVSIRTTLFAELDFSPLRVGAELHDARAYGADLGSGISTGEVNALELIQAYVAADFGDRLGDGSQASVQIGRFKLDAGSRRLVGANNFRNTTNAFTGAALRWSRGDSGLLAFYTLPQTRLPENRPALLDNEVAWDLESPDLTLWGVFLSEGGLPGSAIAEVFVVGLREDDAFDRPTRNRDLTTYGGRLYRNPAALAWDFEIEVGFQNGSSRASASPADVTDLEVEAAYAHLEAGRSFGGLWTPRLAFEYDFASGDKTPADDAVNRFDSLYGPRRPDFGPTGIYGPLGRSNISSPGIRVEVRPDDRWDGFVFYRALWLDEARDAFANTGVRDVSGTSGRFAGHQVEARARYWIYPSVLRLEFGGAVLVNGRFLDQAPNATGQGDTVYGYVDITRTF